MKAVLAHLGNMIHDTSERVRCAFVDLLLKVKGVLCRYNMRRALLRCRLSMGNMQGCVRSSFGILCRLSTWCTGSKWTEMPWASVSRPCCSSRSSPTTSPPLTSCQGVRLEKSCLACALKPQVTYQHRYYAANRCEKLVDVSARGARKFYLHLPRFAPHEALGGFGMALCNHILAQLNLVWRRPCRRARPRC